MAVNLQIQRILGNEDFVKNFLSFVDHISCNADTYVSLGGSNGCANQLTNLDGTQKLKYRCPSYIFPIPVTVMLRISYIKCIYVEIVYRVIHSAKLHF